MNANQLQKNNRNCYQGLRRVISRAALSLWGLLFLLPKFRYDEYDRDMDIKLSLRPLVPAFLLDWYHRIFPFLGAIWYGFPSKKLIIIGVTGTNGKTTVVEWIARILEEAGHKVASVSSVQFKTGEQVLPNMYKMTMPGRFVLQKFLHDAVRAGCQYAVIEVTSEGILQHRHEWIDFDVAVFTNLSPEHIERHGGFERYRAAKGQLFDKLKTRNENLKTTNKNLKTKKISVVNLDDENVDYFLQFPADTYYGYTLAKSADTFIFKSMKVLEGEEVQTTKGGIQFRVHKEELFIPISGVFNVYNALAAICVGLSQGVDLETCRRALEKMSVVPGRMEIVVQKPFTVIVDYAHTPVALESVYKTIEATSHKQSAINNRMICIFGAAGGGRDRWKRPELGKIAAQYCDTIILTNEDSYDEDPISLLKEIESGIASHQPLAISYLLIVDRREAIRKALELAKPGDTVIITGKGSEPWMCFERGKKIPWDDCEVVREEMSKFSILN